MSTRPSAHSQRISWLPVLTLGLSLVSLGACQLDFSPQAEARDSWTHSYPLDKGGTLELRETNGSIRVQAVDGDTIEVKATRIVKASTEDAAKDDLKRFEIEESASPSLVRVDGTKGTSGIHIGLSRRVDYEVSVPRWANVTLKSTNGVIDVTGLGGMFTVDAVNGRITATDLEQAADVETVNGRIDLTFAKLGDNGVRCQTVNGAITVTIPRATKATLTASVANGSISTDNLDVTDTDDSRRRFEGALNGGGAEIKLTTVNGAIKIAGR